jgi:uncharacterized protein YlzI (FlbEa/FlbD family)
MIKLTRMNDLEPTGLGERPVWLNLEHVVSVEPVMSERVEWSTSITMSYGFVGVKESTEEVVRLIEEATAEGVDESFDDFIQRDEFWPLQIDKPGLYQFAKRDGRWSFEKAEESTQQAYSQKARRPKDYGPFGSPIY